jgi:hypothetical protein
MIKTKKSNSDKIKSLFRDFQIQILEGRKFTLKQVDTDILEFDKLKLESPLNIIRRKIQIADRLGFAYSEKHNLDLQHILIK